MMINLENYEIYAIDYLDGHLDKETTAEMVRFLINHPEIKAELESMIEPVTMTPDHGITFEPKAILKKEEKKRAILYSSLMKYAAAIALLLSISSVWYLNTKSTLGDITAATKIDTTTNGINTPAPQKSPIVEPSPIAEVNISTPIKEAPTNSNYEITKTPKQINTPLKELVNPNYDINEIPVQAQDSKLIKPVDPIPIARIKNQTDPIIDISLQAPKRIELTTKSIDILAGLDPVLSKGSIKDGISITPPPSITIDLKAKKSKGSWILDAITKKSDGTNIFAFEGVKRALTPTRLRDVNVGKTSTDSPLKQFTND